jgi:hypothetical protein
MLDTVAGAGGREVAGIEMETIHPERRGFKQAVGDYVRPQPIGVSFPNSCDRDMRHEFPLFLLDTGMGESSLDLLVEQQ